MQQNKKSNILNIILVFLLIVFIGATAFIIISKSTSPSTSDDNTTANDEYIDPLPYRIAMSDDARELADRSAPGSEFIAKLTEDIEAAPSQNVRRSLEIYLIFLSHRHGFSEDAILLYDEYLADQDSLTAAELCELTEYRYFISQYYLDPSYDEDFVLTTRESACQSALSSEPYIQSSTETDYSYAVRLYYSGFLTTGANLLEALDFNTLSEEEISTVSYLLKTHFVFTAQFEKLINI